MVCSGGNDWMKRLGGWLLIAGLELPAGWLAERRCLTG